MLSKEARESGVAILTLNRPDRMNGWGGGLAAGFYAGLDRAEADPAVRAIVITGNGRAFCAGADMGDLNSIGSATVDPVTAKVPGPVGDVGWGGAASTTFWVDPVEDLTVTFMTQLLPSSTHPIRSQLKQLVHQALID